MVCVADAAGCLGALAQGLRREFAPAARALFPVLLDKLKDKNSAVCAQSGQALAAFHRQGPTCCAQAFFWRGARQGRQRLPLQKAAVDSRVSCKHLMMVLRVGKVCCRHCVSLADTAEDFAGAMAHKNPKLKLDALKLLQVAPYSSFHVLE